MGATEKSEYIATALITSERTIRVHAESQWAAMDLIHTALPDAVVTEVLTPDEVLAKGRPLRWDREIT